ncbi:MAG TPA: antibiotic biosynthesis monooxygenase family protein [Ktedonobacterales bacterium]|nr:antibiotic biosynthesis monooxygenase family protein [Ktedonobacterales bacterium]
MSVTRISEFRARAGKSDELRAFLVSIVPGIASSPGCQSAQLLQGHDDPARFVVIEVWDSMDAHQASVKNIPPEAVTSIMPLLDSPPRGDYFHT